ncbi:uncharacterized protein LOC135503332 isoform X2 [Lineus longissimus]|uniref:uncharacterized protein LOC135503332 isoform X2 n=1 Tax=Lineus longissimus TaxID=88925 RepID=UPI002B4F0C1F
MPNYRTIDPEDEVECPYDKSHMIRAKRFPYHLMKCRKNYVGIDFAVCPFNARHEMPRPELPYHTANCPDKHLIEQDIMFEARKNRSDSGVYFKGNTNVPSYDLEWNRPEPTEDWDAEVPAVVRVGVDPKILNAPGTYRSLTGMRPAEKKEYKKRLVQIEERKKQGLSYDDLLEDMTGTKAAKAKRDEEERLAREAAPQGQLRVPKEKPRVVQQQEVLQNKLLMSAGIGRGRPPQFQPPSAPVTNSGYPNTDVAGTHLINQNTMLLAQLARGRGMALGRGQPVPTVGLAAPGTNPPRGVGSINSESSSNSNDEEAPTKNRGRKLQKKLREIDVLLRRQKLGATLDADQLEKISQYDDILTKLEQLELE